MSQSNWALFNGTWQKRRRALDPRLSLEIREMTHQSSIDDLVLYVSFQKRLEKWRTKTQSRLEKWRTLRFENDIRWVGKRRGFCHVPLAKDVTWQKRRRALDHRLSFEIREMSQSNWALFNGTWQKRRRALDHRLSLEIREMTQQMQQAVQSGIMHTCESTQAVGANYFGCDICTYTFFAWEKWHTKCDQNAPIAKWKRAINYSGFCRK